MAVCRVGLISDTHGRIDEIVPEAFGKVQLLLHAGDVGHHGGHQEVLEKLKAVAPVLAVRGNVDDSPAAIAALPDYHIVECNGWRVLLKHIVGLPPAVHPDARGLVAAERPDIVVFGHSHQFGMVCANDIWYINPGSAGPARFKLFRTAAVLELPEKGCGQPVVTRLELPRLPARARQKTAGSQRAADAASAQAAEAARPARSKARPIQCRSK